jgi:hypothetical protein
MSHGLSNPFSSLEMLALVLLVASFWHASQAACTLYNTAGAFTTANPDAALNEWTTEFPGLVGTQGIGGSPYTTSNFPDITLSYNSGLGFNFAFGPGVVDSNPFTSIGTTSSDYLISFGPQRAFGANIFTPSSAPTSTPQATFTDSEGNPHILPLSNLGAATNFFVGISCDDNVSIESIRYEGYLGMPFGEFFNEPFVLLPSE